jgi:hypothetical protein
VGVTAPAGVDWAAGRRAGAVLAPGALVVGCAVADGLADGVLAAAALCWLAADPGANGELGVLAFG